MRIHIYIYVCVNTHIFLYIVHILRENIYTYNTTPFCNESFNCLLIKWYVIYAIAFLFNNWFTDKNKYFIYVYKQLFIIHSRSINYVCKNRSLYFVHCTMYNGVYPVAIVLRVPLEVT